VKGLCQLLERFEISPDARILDFSCGIGNHSIPLSSRGYSVVGYDPSPHFLKVAMQRAAEFTRQRKGRLKFITGSPYRSSETLINNNETNFDVIIIMDNSFGYMQKSRDINMLKNLLKVAKQNCILIIETENRDWRLLNFEPITSFESVKTQIYGMWKFNFETSVSEGLLKFYERRSIDDSNLQLRLELQMQLRLYSLHELIEIINKAGWKYRECYDDIISLKPFSSSNMSIFSISLSNSVI
jgi:SAM-dependent methyltransferase